MKCGGKGRGQVVRTWGGHACPSTNRWRRVSDKDNFNSNGVTRKLAEIQTQMWSINQDRPFCQRVTSFCSPIYCLIPGLSYRQDCWFTVKIILHRIISVVWLTNFPSEIRRLTIPRWWARASFSWAWKGAGPSLELATAHWWSLVAALCTDKGKDVAWVVSCILKWGQSRPL